MAGIQKLNRLLAKEFGGRISAVPERGHLALRGESADWGEIVRAGHLAAKHNKSAGVVNDVHFTGQASAPTRLPCETDCSLEGASPDVLVIGGGVVGCAVARELSRSRLDILLVEKECDVALHASSRNDGMIHPGLDIRKGSQKYDYNKRGNRMFGKTCAALGVDFTQNGQYLCFPKKMPFFVLYLSLPYWKWMGIPAKVLSRRQLFAREPGLHPALHCALYFPSAGSVCPYGLTIAYAENAIENGAALSLSTAATGMELRDGRITAVHTNRGTVHPRVVVNAAGVFSEEIAAMAGDRFFSIHPRRGTNSICDKKVSDRIARNHCSTLLTGSSKGAHTKGGGVIRTVHDNLLIGPNAEESPEKEDFSTRRESIDAIFAKQAKTSEKLRQGQIITYFTGIRAATFEEDFVVRPGLYTENIIHCAGIQSPGLTAAPALGVAVAKMAVQALEAQSGETVQPNAAFNPVRAPIPSCARLDDAAREALIRENPDYGVILCRCEEISRGEILAALRRPLPCGTVDGVKRRVRAGMGRCQGGFCGPQVAQLIAQEKGIPLARVRKSGEGSELLFGETKAALREEGEDA
ncbi:MAG: FAD-dependent oxidoreductase [Oscillospiraceae bacterium]|jgi:glycerol-3-phosphate dehydrogenase|nr:FAD-dependent oxidoreductase [Oscillospiraceae bacterium]